MRQACLLLLCSRWDLCAAFQSSFLGGRLAGVALKHYNNAAVLTMRKQKASDKRTRRRQRGQEEQPLVIPETFTTSPMQVATANTPQRYSSITPLVEDDFVAKGGRGRSRKRSTLYKTIALYRHKFLTLLTDEYKAEEKEILSRIETDDPLGLETAGYALLDLVPMRRGNLFTDEVYRLTKGPDCTTGKPDELPAQHRFRKNDVVVLTLQNSSGDFFECSPINEACKTVEARVLNVSPTHLDISVLAGMFEAQLGSPAPNDISGQGNASMRLRLDRFFSKVPYDRMVSALSQVTTLPRREGEREGPPRPPHESIAIDEVLREVVLSTHAFWDPESPFSKDPSVCNLDELVREAKTPRGHSQRWLPVILHISVLQAVQGAHANFRQTCQGSPYIHEENLSLRSIECTSANGCRSCSHTSSYHDPGSTRNREDDCCRGNFVWVRPSMQIAVTAYKGVGLCVQ